MNESLDPLRNPLDPLNEQPDADKKLFRLLARNCHDVPAPVVASASANLIVNAIRQQCASRKNALDAFDAVATKARAILADHYDGAGKRRNVFPFSQVVDIPFVPTENKFFKT